MSEKKLSNIFMSIILACGMCLVLSSCKNTGGSTTGGASNVQKPATQTKNLSALQTTSKNLGVGDFNTFTAQTANGFNYIAKGIMEYPAANSQAVQNQVIIINNEIPLIKAAKNPLVLAKNEQTSFNAAISALTTINSQTADANIKNAVSTNLAQSQQLSAQLNDRNYNATTQQLFNNIYTAMYDLHKKSK